MALKNKGGRPKQTEVQMLLNALHRELFNVLSDMRIYKSTRQCYIKMYYGDTDLSTLKDACQKLVNIIHSIETAKLGSKPILSKRERLQYLRKQGDRK
jgi:hypothetical protein